MAAPTPSPPPKLDLPGTCRRRRDGTAFPPPLAGFPLPLPHLFSGLAKKLFTNRLVSAIIIPLSQVRAGGSMDRASDSGSEGWGFESLLAYQTEQIRTLRRCSSSAVCLVFVSPDFPAGRFAVDCKMGKEKICPTAPKRVAVGFFLRFYSISTRRTASAVDSEVRGFLNA